MSEIASPGQLEYWVALRSMLKSQHSFRGLLSALGLVLIANVVFAQTTMAEGALVGTVVDPQGARVTTTSLIIEKKGFARKLSVDKAGEFKIQLPAGKYQLTAEAVGFQKYRRKIVIASGKTESLRIKLDVMRQKFKCPPGHICL